MFYEAFAEKTTTASVVFHINSNFNNFLMLSILKLIPAFHSCENFNTFFAWAFTIFLTIKKFSNRALFCIFDVSFLPYRTYKKLEIFSLEDSIAFDQMKEIFKDFWNFMYVNGN